MQLYITRGPYAGRFIEMEDAWAEKAKADGWARENASLSADEKKAEAERLKSGEPDVEPGSLKDWIDSLNPGAAASQDGRVSGEKTPPLALQPGSAETADGAGVEHKSESDAESEEQDADSDARGAVNSTGSTSPDGGSANTGDSADPQGSEPKVETESGPGSKTSNPTATRTGAE